MDYPFKICAFLKVSLNAASITLGSICCSILYREYDLDVCSAVRLPIMFKHKVLSYVFSSSEGGKTPMLIALEKLPL